MEETNFNYNQSILGLMLLGAKADGEFQEEEKKLIVELTSEKHVLSTEEYREVIESMKKSPSDDFAKKVYKTLHSCSFDNKLEAIYWLIKLLKVDDSTDHTDKGHLGERMTFQEALKELGLTDELALQYEEKKDESKKK